MPEHTPGPLMVGSREPRAICTQDGYVLYRGRPEFTEGDARLYAAAPRMLRVLEDMLGDAPSDGKEYPVLGSSRVVGEVVAAARGREADDAQ